MRATQDTTHLPAPESAAERLVLVVREGVPAAEAAGWVVDTGREVWGDAPPTCVLVADAMHANFVEHLVQRLRSLPGVPGAYDSLLDVVHSAVDGGATLVHGGRPSDDGGWQPTLFLNLPPGTLLLSDPDLRGPVLAVARVRSPEDEAVYLDAVSGETRVLYLPETAA